MPKASAKADAFTHGTPTFTCIAGKQRDSDSCGREHPTIIGALRCSHPGNHVWDNAADRLATITPRQRKAAESLSLLQSRELSPDEIEKFTEGVQDYRARKSAAEKAGFYWEEVRDLPLSEFNALLRGALGRRQV